MKIRNSFFVLLMFIFSNYLFAEKKGHLVICGGGSLTHEVYEEFIHLGGGQKTRLVVIPSAYIYEDEEDMLSTLNKWKKFNLEGLDLLHTDDFDEANDENFSKILDTATAVWMNGGTQGRLLRRYYDTHVMKKLQKLLARGGVIGGTSAGASIMSDIMIRYSSDNTDREAVLDRGFNLDSRFIIDQHFTEEGRFPRLISVIEKKEGFLGIGVDESTAAIVHGNQIRALSDETGMVNLFYKLSNDSNAIVINRLKHGEEALIEELADGNGKEKSYKAF